MRRQRPDLLQLDHLAQVLGQQLLGRHAHVLRAALPRRVRAHDVPRRGRHQAHARERVRPRRQVALDHLVEERGDAPRALDARAQRRQPEVGRLRQLRAARELRAVTGPVGGVVARRRDEGHVLAVQVAARVEVEQVHQRKQVALAAGGVRRQALGAQLHVRRHARLPRVERAVEAAEGRRRVPRHARVRVAPAAAAPRHHRPQDVHDADRVRQQALVRARRLRQRRRRRRRLAAQHKVGVGRRQARGDACGVKGRRPVRAVGDQLVQHEAAPQRAPARLGVGPGAVAVAVALREALGLAVEPQDLHEADRNAQHHPRAVLVPAAHLHQRQDQVALQVQQADRVVVPAQGRRQLRARQGRKVRRRLQRAAVQRLERLVEARRQRQDREQQPQRHAVRRQVVQQPVPHEEREQRRPVVVEEDVHHLPDMRLAREAGGGQRRRCRRRGIVNGGSLSTHDDFFTFSCSSGAAGCADGYVHDRPRFRQPWQHGHSPLHRTLRVLLVSKGQPVQAPSRFVSSTYLHRPHANCTRPTDLSADRAADLADIVVAPLSCNARRRRSRCADGMPTGGQPAAGLGMPHLLFINRRQVHYARYASLSVQWVECQHLRAGAALLSTTHGLAGIR